MGCGNLIKFNKLFFNEIILFIIVLSSFFFALLYSSRKFLNLSYYIVLISIILIIGLPIYIYQEWFDPIYLIILYILMPSSKIINMNLIKSSSIYFLFVWEFIIIVIGIFFYHFYLKIPFFYSF